MSVVPPAKDTEVAWCTPLLFPTTCGLQFLCFGYLCENFPGFKFTACPWTACAVIFEGKSSRKLFGSHNTLDSNTPAVKVHSRGIRSQGKKRIIAGDKTPGIFSHLSGFGIELRRNRSCALIAPLQAPHSSTYDLCFITWHNTREFAQFFLLQWTNNSP